MLVYQRVKQLILTWSIMDTPIGRMERPHLSLDDQKEL